MKQSGNMFKQLAALQQRMDVIRKEISTATFVGKAANGLATVTMSGEGAITRVDLAPDLKAENLETIADLIVIASNDANAQKEQMSKEKLSKVAGGMMPLGMKFPGIG